MTVAQRVWKDVWEEVVHSVDALRSAIENPLTLKDRAASNILQRDNATILTRA